MWCSSFIKKLKTYWLCIALVLAFALITRWRVGGRYWIADSLVENGMQNSFCPSHGVLLYDMGRMGNKFFEYLAARLLAMQVGRHLFVFTSFRDSFNRYFDKLQCRVLDIRTFKNNCSAGKLFHLPINRLLQISEQNLSQFPFIQVHGYPLNITVPIWKEIFDRQQEFRNEFQFRDHFQSETSDYIKKLTSNHSYSVLVGMHIRMKDYQSHLKKLYGSSKLPDREYFSKAMNYFKQRYGNPLFLVVSNDMQWCKKNLLADDIVLAGEGKEDDPGWDLSILASCHHTIMTYGSFGMMAGYLAGGTVVAADNFTPTTNPLVDNIQALRLPNWIWFHV